MEYGSIDLSIVSIATIIVFASQLAYYTGILTQLHIIATVLQHMCVHAHTQTHIMDSCTVQTDRQSTGTITSYSPSVAIDQCQHL